MIDIHTHVETFETIPDKWLSVMSITGAETIVSDKLFRAIVRIFTRIRGKIANWLSCISLLQTLKLSKLGELIDMYKLPMFEAGNVMYNEIQEAGIELSTPLLMDLEFATNTKEKPELDYGLQVDIMKRLAKKYFGKVMPFVCFDPRRPDANEFIKFCLFDKGVLGVKLYPKLGFHPSFKSTYNSFKVNEILFDFYKMAEENEIPITMHCSPGGAYCENLIGKKDQRNTLVHPTALEEVFEVYPNLRFNFAHSGGDLYKYNEYYSNTWIWWCVKYARELRGVYMDTAYHSDAHNKKIKTPYFYTLNYLLESDVGNKIMYGSDWSMIAHTWNMKEFIQPFIENVDITLKDKFFYQNAIKFLFPELKIPKRIFEGLGLMDDEGNPLYNCRPKWLASKFTEIEGV